MKNSVELKNLSARIQAEVSEKKMRHWVDSGSPVTILCMTDLKATLGKANLHLQPIRQEFFGLQQQSNTYTGGK